MKIEYNGNITESSKREIERFLNKYLWLIPKWVLSVYVDLNDASEDGMVASVNVNYDYRYLTVNFRSAWLDRSEEVKEVTVIHELLHAYFALIADFARDNFNRLCPPDDAAKFNELLLEELRVRHESATEDLTHTIFDLQKKVG